MTMKTTKTLYTLRYSRGVDYPTSGLLHASFDCSKTLCGKTITLDWWIMSSDNKGKITCAKCSRLFGVNHPHSQD